MLHRRNCAAFETDRRINQICAIRAQLGPDANPAPHLTREPRRKNPQAPERRLMTRTLFALSLGFVGLILATHASFAAPQCGPRAALLAELSAKYNETRRGIGVAANNQVMELFASAESGSWTITVTLPEGTTCLVASGQNFEAISEELPAKGDPA